MSTRRSVVRVGVTLVIALIVGSPTAAKASAMTVTHSVGHLAIDLRDEPRLGSHCFRAFPDTLLQPEPVGQRRDDRITSRAVVHGVEWTDHDERYR